MAGPLWNRVDCGLSTMTITHRWKKGEWRPFGSVYSEEYRRLGEAQQANLCHRESPDVRDDPELVSVQAGTCDIDD